MYRAADPEFSHHCSDLPLPLGLDAVPSSACSSRDSGIQVGRTKSEYDTLAVMEEGRKRVLAIVAGILVARHLKTTEDLFDTKPSPRTESLVAAAVQWAERIMKKIDGVYR